MSVPLFLIRMVIVALSIASVPGQGIELGDMGNKIEAEGKEVPGVAAGKISAETAHPTSISAEQTVDPDDTVVVAKAKAERRRHADIDERFDFLMLLLQVLQGPK